MIKHIALLAIIFVLSLPASALAAEPGSGIIEGRVVNGTAGGGSVANQDITLNTYLNDAEIGATTAKTNTDGQFVFDGVSTGSGYSYQVTLVFQEAEYYSEWLNFDDGETTEFAEVTVYDSTTSDEAIKVAMSHTIIYVGQGSLKVMEYLFFTNVADLTYIGPEEAAAVEGSKTLRFALPAEATETQITLGLMVCCIRDGDGGFVDTMPFLPGGKEVAYSYTVNHNSGTYTFSQNVNYPTTRYDLLLQGEYIGPISDQLTAEEPMDIEGTLFKHFSSSNLAPGDTLVVQLSSLPDPNRSGGIIWVALVLVVLIVGFGFIYLLRKRRLQPVSTQDSLDQKKQRLLVELAHMDDAFEEGKIPEDVYHRLRAEGKAQLVELMQRTKEESGNR